MTGQVDHLILRLDAPMQAWGAVAMDPVRPTYGFPTRSALAGLIASALGWRYRDGARTTALQDAILYAVREDRPPRRLADYQTADLGRIGREGWTRWGMERRGGGPAATGTHILDKVFLADGVFIVALTLDAAAPVDLDAVEAALRRPMRPLFLGRKSCIPASPVLVGRLSAVSQIAALRSWPFSEQDRVGRPAPERLVCWSADGEGDESGEAVEVSDRRDFVADTFGGVRTLRHSAMKPPGKGREPSHE